MLSPADYAAYSRATGLAYPQSDEEKAGMYGDVREFRRNQLKKTMVLTLPGQWLLAQPQLVASQV